MKEWLASSRKSNERNVEITQPLPELDDFKDSPQLYNLLIKLPSELRPRHISHIEDLSDADAEQYLQEVLGKREAAVRESFVSDESIQDYFTTNEREILHALETYVLEDTDNFIDSGTTARIKSFKISETVPTLAVKYLVHPTPTTLHVDIEHNIISEVERMEKIEKAAAQGTPLEYIKVPHPYFYHRKGKIQCYGMEFIDGINLWEATTREYNSALKDELREKFQDIDQERLMVEVDHFFDTMHEICVHNDVKQRNIMVSREGTFYLIDFGQSISTTSVDDKMVSKIEDRKDEEKKLAKSMIAHFLITLRA